MSSRPTDALADRHGRVRWEPSTSARERPRSRPADGAVGREPARGHAHRGRPGGDARGRYRSRWRHPALAERHGDTVWAAVDGEAKAQAPRPRRQPHAGFELRAGRERSEAADLLLVSDLPLQGGIRMTATQMAQAITFVAARARLPRRALRRRLPVLRRLRRAHGALRRGQVRGERPRLRRQRRRRGVIGPLNSPCAVAALPDLNRARGGPLAMVSPLTSFVGLTRRRRASPRTARRRCTRLAPQLPARVPDGRPQGAALALLARDRGTAGVRPRRREPGYGELMATGFATAARRLGLDRRDARRGIRARTPTRRVAGGWRRRSPRPSSSAGLLDTNAAAVIRDLRAAAPDADISRRTG